MKKEVDTRFWTFNQNNSGGYFVVDEKNGVCEVVIIEARNSKEAWSKMENIGEKVSGFFVSCECCGDRWCDWLSESDGKEKPLLYGQLVEEVEIDTFMDRAFIHYYDGEIKEVKFKQSENINHEG